MASGLDKPTDRTSENNITTVSAAIKSGDLELADKLYLKFRGKYPDSDRLAGMMLDLAKAHMDAQEYLLARYYTEAYIREYPGGIRADKAWFLRTKSLFLKYKNQDSSPDIADRFKSESKAFLKTFPKSKYIEEIKSLQEQMREMLIKKNEEIAKTYEKMGKLKAAQYYRNKNKDQDK